MKWQSIVFDLDDTLYPERSYVLSGFRAVAAWMAGQENIPEEEGYAELCALYESGVRGSTFNQWLSARQCLSDALLQRLVQVYRDHDPDLQPFAAVPPLLDRLKGSCKLGLISDGYLTVQRRKLAGLGLGHYFDAVVFSDTWGREAWKPSQRPFQEALRVLQSAPEQTVYIGDNPLKDFYGARASGWSTIWLRQAGLEYTRHEPPSPAHGPDLVVEEYAGLAEVLGKAQGW